MTDSRLGREMRFTYSEIWETTPFIQQYNSMVIAGTGHRPDKLGGYSALATAKLKKVIIPWLVEFKPERALVGMAIGFDQALAMAAIDLGIPVTAAIPFEGQEDKWPTASRIVYKIILEKCDARVIVTGGGYAGWKMQKRNEFMVDQLASDDDNVLLTMHDGSEGGTYNCLEYAHNMYPDMKIVNLYDNWKSLN